MDNENMSTVEIAKILIKSTANYYYSNIYNNKDKNAYLKGAREVYSILEHHNDMNKALEEISKLKNNLPTAFFDRLEVFSDTKRHYSLSFEHAIDILTNLNNRFVTGAADPDDIFVYNILEDKRENKGFFRKI